MDAEDKMQQLKELRKFLEEGRSIDEAASLAGLALDDAVRAIIEWRVHQAYDKDVLRETSKDAVVVGMKTLKSLAINSESDDVAVKAAAELVKFALAARKIMSENAAPESADKPKGKSLWSFLPKA